MKQFITVLLAFAPMALFAQTDEDQTELKKTIQVYSEYKPQISDASRISVNPKVYDTLNLEVNLKYDVKTSPLSTDYHIIPLKAVSVKGDKLQELYKGEIVAGLGNYWNSLFAFRYTTERSRLKQAGVELYHYGSAGKVKLYNDEKIPAGFSTDYVKLYLKRFYDKFTLSASLQPQYRSVLRYGLNTDYYDSLEYVEKKDVRRNVFGVAGNVGIVANVEDEDDVRYGADVDYDLTYVNPKNMENLIGLSGNMEKIFDRFTAGFNADIQLSALNYQPIDSSLSKIQGVGIIAPYVKVGAYAWDLTVGVNASPIFGGENAFKIFPDIAFAYTLPKLKMIPYLNFYGARVSHNSMKDMLTINPYTADNMMIRPTVNVMGFEVGVNGRIQKLITYNAQFSVDAYRDMYFWRAQRTTIPSKMSTLDEMNTVYTVEYDDASCMKLHGDMGFLFRKANCSLDVNYYLWQPKELSKPWYKPVVDLSLSPRFTIIHPTSNKTKLTVEPKVYYMLYQAESHGDGDVSNRSIFDFCVETNYHYNSVLDIFLDLNNICGINNECYLDYPTQRFNFMVGLSYSFAGHKE